MSAWSWLPARLPSHLPAQQGGGAGGADFSFFLMMGAIFLIFYFLVIRPQSRRQKELEERVKRAAKGDRVITSGGLHGKVVATGDDVLTLEIAMLKGGQSVRVDVSRGRIESVVSPQEAKEAKEDDADEDKKGGKK